MGTLKQISRIQSDDPSLNRLQDQLASALNPILRNVKGDLSGPLESPTVSGIQGRNVAPAPPAIGNALIWNGSQWAPGVGSGGVVTLAGDVTGASNANTVEKIQNQPVSSAVPSTGDALAWDGGQWASTALGGDVTGSIGANTVGAIQGYGVSATAPSTNDALVWNGSLWSPSPVSGGGVYPQMPTAWGTEYLWWKMDDAPQAGATPNTAINYGTGGTATLTATNNATGGNSNGAAFYSKTPIFGVSGPYSTVARFRGSYNTLQGADAVYPSTTNFTLTTWANISESGGGYACNLVVKKHSSGFSVAVTTSGTRAYFTIRTAAGEVTYYTATYVMMYGLPVMLALTYDGSNIYGYLNGEEVVSGAQTGAIVWTTGAGSEWEVGQPTGGIERYDIWDVRVAPSVRTQAQLLADYKTGAGYSY